MNSADQNKFLLGLVLVAAVSLWSVDADAAVCTRNSDKAITNALSSGTACTVTPDEVRFPIYKFGLCETVPTYLNYQTACEFLYDNSAGRTIPITTSSTFDLVKDISISEGTYLAAVVLVGNTIKVKHSEQFANPRNGLEKNGASYQKSDGLYCVTRLDGGSEDDFVSNLDCGDSSLQAGLFSETNGAYDTNGIGGRCSIIADKINSNISFTTSSGKTDVCGMLDGNTLEIYSNGASNATKQVAVQTFRNPVVVSANTQTMAIAFKVTNMLSIEAQNKTVSGTLSLYTQAYLDGFEIRIDVE